MKGLMVSGVVALVLSLGFGLAQAAEDDEDAVPAGAKVTTGRGCLAYQSLALCVAKEAKVAIGMKDATAENDKVGIPEAERGGAGWYLGMAAGTGAKVFRTTHGMSRGSDVTMMLLGALLSSKGPHMIGRNLVVGWMPASMAKDVDEASAKGASIVWEATKASFPGSTFTPETMEGGAVSYRVTGGVCEGKECVLVPVLKKAGSAELMGCRATTAKTPRFMGSEESYRFSSRLGSIYPMTLLVDGKVQTHAYMRELSRNLPAWMYVAVSPETKLDSGLVFNEGVPEPVLFNGGAALLFRFPEPKAIEAVALR